MRKIIWILIAIIVVFAGGGGYELNHLNHELTAANATISQDEAKIQKDKQVMASDQAVIKSVTDSSQKLSDSILSAKSNLVVSDVKATRNGMLVYVTGLVKNDGNKESILKSVNVIVFAKDGSVLGSGTTLIQPIPPGSQVGFQAMVAGINYNSVIDHAEASVN